jgi:LytS/YehU family sensor histidine kinase
VLIAALGFALCMCAHFAAPAPRAGRYGEHFLRVLLFAAPAAFLTTVYSHFQFTWVAPPNAPAKEFWSDMAFSYAYYLWIFVSWSAAYVGLHAMRDSQSRARQIAEIEARASFSQLAALRYQLNPHFFFNVLNTLSGLVGARRLAEAEQVIVRMADFLRYSLRGEPTELVPLEDELAAQEAYLEIERVRFGQRLNVVFDLPGAGVRAQVPPLILQPLVENAIKHAMARSEAPVTVTIGARCEDGVLKCWVENSEAPRETTGAPNGLGVGLRNVKERLCAVYGDGARLEAGRTPQGGWRSTISIPLGAETCAS